MAYYEELNPIAVGIIGERFLRNEKLCKLLHYYEKNDNSICDPLSKPYVEGVTNDLFMKNIFPMPKSPNASTKKEAYVTVVLSGGYEAEENTGFRRVNLLIDIICHLDTWIIKGGFRPYSIMHEIDKMLNNQITDLPIVNKPYLRGFQPRDYSNYFYGFQVIYELSINSNIACNAKPQNLNIEENSTIKIPSYLPKNLNLRNR